MARTKIREITVTKSKKGIFIAKKSGTSKKDYDFEGISALRKILSNEKARLLHVIKTQNPGSIYELAKKLDRGFKAVSDDVKLLERFGFIDIIEENTKNRKRHKPEIAVETLTIHIKV